MADVASSFKNWSKSAASNFPTSATVIGSGLAPNLQQIQATLRTELGARSSSITAASTVDLNSVDEGTVLVSHASGTVSISSFGTVQSGIKKLVTFSVSSGTLTLVYNATSMIVPSAANIVIADGDSLLAESLGSGNWKIHSYSKFSGEPIVGTATTASSDPTFVANDDNAVSSNWVRGLLNMSGSAPYYAARAAIEFDGTASSPTIRSNKNVTSVTKLSTGKYTINLAVAMPSFYSVSSGAGTYGSTSSTTIFIQTNPINSSSFFINIRNAQAIDFDCTSISAHVIG